MKKLLEDFFNSFDFDFVLLFGSYASQTPHELSDVDIGIYAKDSLELKELGFISATLEAKLGKKTDVVMLNDIEEKDPNFAFSILENHTLVDCKNEKKYIEFKTRAQISYLDHKKLIEQNILDIKKRLKSGDFARRNYAS